MSTSPTTTTRPAFPQKQGIWELVWTSKQAENSAWLASESEAVSLVKRLESRRIDRLTRDALRVTRYVIKRLEFPKYGDPVTISATDRMDCEAAGMAAITESGFFDHGNGIITEEHFKAVRNAIAGKAGLRLRCRWEIQEDDGNSLLSMAERFSLSAYQGKRKNPSRNNTKSARAIMRVLRAAQTADKGRKSLCNFKSQRDFFLSCLAISNGNGSRAMSPDTFRKRKERFLDYLAQGAQELKKPSLSPEVSNSIISALASRALA